MSRELTPFEHLVANHLCDGLSNAAIARTTSHSEKVIENTVSRMARAFGINSNGDTNVRVLLALAVLVGMRVSKVPLEVGVGHGVAADGAATARVLEFFAYG